MRRILLLILMMSIALAACNRGGISAPPRATDEALAQTSLPAASVTQAPPAPGGCPPFSFDTALPSNPDDAESYLGHHYDDLNMPPGLEFRGAAMIDEVYAWVNVVRPDHQMFWLEKFICRDASGRAYFNILSAVSAPLEGGQYVRSDAGCVDSSGNRADVFIAFGHYDLNQSPAPVDKWTMTDLDHAFRIDLAHEKLIPVPVEGLICYHMIGLVNP